MKFDELKDIWQNEEIIEKELTTKMDQLKRYSSPIKQIRKNMKNEFFFSSIFLIIVVIVLFINPKFNYINRITLTIMSVIVIIPVIYYYFKFLRIT